MPHSGSAGRLVSRSSHGPRTDPLFWIALGVWGVSILPSFLPVLSPAATYTYADEYSDVPMLVMAGVALVIALRRTSSHGERLFFRLIVGGLAAWLAVRASYTLMPAALWGETADLIQDFLYLAGYLLFAISLETQPFAPRRLVERRRLHTVEILGTLVFVFGLLAYFVVIPSVFNPEVYASWVPSLLLYAVLDAYLVIRTLTLLNPRLPAEWRDPARWLAVTFALWLVSDMAEGLMYLEVLPWVDPGTPVDLLWHLPGLALFVAVRSRGWSAGAPTPGEALRPDEEPRDWSVGGGWLVGLAFTLPALHSLLSAIDPTFGPSERPREILLLALLVVYGVLLVMHERMHRARTMELQSAERTAAEQLQVAQKMEAVGRLAAGVAHDFSNILSVIRGRAELLLMTPLLGVDARDDAEEIVQAATRGQGLVSRLISVSRRRPGARETLDLREVVEGLRPLLERVIQESVIVRVIVGDEPAPVLADRAHLEQVILNLVVNARDAMATGGRLTLRTGIVDLDTGSSEAAARARPGAYVRLTVEDTGPGIPEDIRPLIFEPFFSTKGPQEGSGLGLAIVYGIAQESGGFVEVGTAPEGGARFHVYFPLAKERPVPLEPASTRPRGAATGTILLVEDDTGVRATIRRVLTQAGYRVIEASSGGEALAILDRREPISLLFADLVLPDVSGFELRDRAVAGRPGLRVLFMSGYPEGVTPLRVPEGTPILEKPFSPAVLLMTLRHLLSDGGGTARSG